MSELLDTAQKLEKAIEEMFAREEVYAEKRLAAGEAEYDHKQARAIAYRVAEGTIESRKMEADENCAEEMKARFTAEAESEIAKEKLLDVRAALSARQSILNAETKRMI